MPDGVIRGYIFIRNIATHPGSSCDPSTSRISTHPLHAAPPGDGLLRRKRRERERMTTPVGLLCYLSLFTCVYLTIAVYTSRAFVMRYLVANKLKANISCRFNCLRVIISGGTIFFRYRRGTRLNETVITMIEWPLVCCSKNQNDRSCHSDFGKNLAEGQSSRIRKL